jgi:N-methylhydantoinase A/oxoprolinase/acetone carboxylase beta subunit
MGSDNKKGATESGLARIAIDRGGTFTDVICSRSDQEDIVFKVRDRGVEIPAEIALAVIG